MPEQAPHFARAFHTSGAERKNFTTTPARHRWF